MAGPFLPKSFRPKIITLVKQIDLETEPARKVKNNTQVRSFRMGKFQANRGGGGFGSELHQQCLVLQGFSDDFSHLGFGMGEKRTSLSTLQLPPINSISFFSEDHHFRRSSFVSETSGAEWWWLFGLGSRAQHRRSSVQINGGSGSSKVKQTLIQSNDP